MRKIKIIFEFQPLATNKILALNLIVYLTYKENGFKSTPLNS